MKMIMMMAPRHPHASSSIVVLAGRKLVNLPLTRTRIGDNVHHVEQPQSRHIKRFPPYVRFIGAHASRKITTPTTSPTSCGMLSP
mmetsp:Transcript_28732/g.81029  ORF Transcript_28732/g.81029 Transcript_28732/m.81029 type:complete len:85 (+) Transcript_28732:270-524(+)